MGDLPQRHQTGRAAEARAAEHLQAEGFHILWRNVRIGPLEVDLVARRGDLAVIVEVRARGSGAFEGPLASIGWNKRRDLLRAARGIWRGRLQRLPGIRRVRIDVIAIDKAGNLEWIPAAITEDGR